MITGYCAANLEQELQYLLDDMHAREQDLIISVFGLEGSGKSRWAMNIGIKLDINFNQDTLRQKTAQTIQDFGRLAPRTPPFNLCWWDEAHRFSKRGQYDEGVNRDLLEYFQDIRGGKKIFILCYPDLEEIDRKVLKRSRLFFETEKQGSTFLVKAWTRKQIELKIRALRLPSPTTRQKLWVGISQLPKGVYYHDDKGLEDLITAYAEFKLGSVKLADQKLSEKYGYRNATNVAVIIWQKLEKKGILGYSVNWLRILAGQRLRQGIDEWNVEQVQQAGDGNWRIFDDSIFDIVVNDVCKDIEMSKELHRPRYKEINVIDNATTRQVNILDIEKAHDIETEMEANIHAEI